MRIELPGDALVLLVGAAGAGKSTFAARHFRATEVLSSDAFRGLVADDPADVGATADAFEALHLVAGKRLAAGRLTVVDATNLRPTARAPLLRLARAHHRAAVAIVFDLPDETCQEWNRRRRRVVPRAVVRRHLRQLRGAVAALSGEGLDAAFVLGSPAEIDQTTVARRSPGA